jgi:hypothetical protein
MAIKIILHAYVFHTFMGVIKPLRGRNVLRIEEVTDYKRKAEDTSSCFLKAFWRYVLRNGFPRYYKGNWFIVLLILACVVQHGSDRNFPGLTARYFQKLRTPLPVVLNGGFPLDFHRWIRKNICSETLYSLWNRRRSPKFQAKQS